MKKAVIAATAVFFLLVGSGLPALAQQHPSPHAFLQTSGIADGPAQASAVVESRPTLKVFAAQQETPTPTTSPGPTSTPKPQETPRPTDTPRPADTPRPVETPKPGETPRPGETSEPVKTPRPGETPEPGKTPKPGETPEPAETPKPGENAKPQQTPRPEETPKPGKTPVPGQTAEPGETSGPELTPNPQPEPAPVETVTTPPPARGTVTAVTEPTAGETRVVVPDQAAIQIHVPAKALPGPVQIQARELPAKDLPAAAPVVPDGRVVKAVQIDLYDLKGAALPSTKLGEPVTIEIPLADEDIKLIGANSANVEVVYFNEATGQWEQVDSTVNLVRKIVVARVNHLSLFAVVIPQPVQGSSLWWLAALMGAVAVAAAAVFTINRRKPSVWTEDYWR